MSAPLPARTAASRLGTTSRGLVIVGFAAPEAHFAARGRGDLGAFYLGAAAG